MAEGAEAIRAEVVVSGRVQGVWFRGTTCQMARELDLTGWVRNRPDGKVAAVFEGEASRVRRMVSWCHHGPRLAQVESVEVCWGRATGEFMDFNMRY